MIKSIESFLERAKANTPACKEYSLKIMHAKSKMEIFKAALEIQSIEFLCKAIDEGWGMTSDEICRDFAPYLNGKCVYDGIFASSDHLAYLIKQELESYGIDVPKDVQIVGFDGIPVRGVGKPIVSSIQQSVESIAAAGVDVLLRLIEDGEAESNIAIPVEFVDGGTTR